MAQCTRIEASLVYLLASSALWITIHYLLALYLIFFALYLLTVFQLLLTLEAVHGLWSTTFISLTDSPPWQAFVLVVP